VEEVEQDDQEFPWQSLSPPPPPACNPWHISWEECETDLWLMQLHWRHSIRSGRQLLSCWQRSRPDSPSHGCCRPWLVHPTGLGATHELGWVLARLTWRQIPRTLRFLGPAWVQHFGSVSLPTTTQSGSRGFWG
jgi:hypothetical protein